MTDEEQKAEAGAKLTKMLIEAENSGISNRTVEEIFDSVLLERGYSQKEIDELSSSNG